MPRNTELTEDRAWLDSRFAGICISTPVTNQSCYLNCDEEYAVGGTTESTSSCPSHQVWYLTSYTRISTVVKRFIPTRGDEHMSYLL